MFSSWFPNPSRASEIVNEQDAKKVIDTFLNYRSKEVAQTIIMAWCVVLGMVFSLLVTIRAAFLVF